ncbi:LRR receptor-like serine/threonine-protein kinase EFR [Lycium barbarum]|uniref:LRR receptor-like serine/threonine-protein kinase EFR n=1 Tax=Lycium barbarum TaxID=112863 RepID=UPI00293EAB49|nr:LRR receptor-like serine/threonine-protein kinase EFR [Lycium barbarum]
MKLRGILKQAINEANAAADLARCENSQLKDCPAIKGETAVMQNFYYQEALLAFRNLVTSPSSFLANNWTNSNYCSWFGVTFSTKRQRVVALTLLNLHLQGTISPSLANLSFLRELNLRNKFFHGSIPYGLGNLPRLRVIDIQNNQLQGSIPSSPFQHQRVQVISFSLNKLGGEMWKGPWYVPELKVLNLKNNSLAEMGAHIGDFGISKILAVSKSMAHTATLGTLGYLAPEYGSEGIVPTSGDVYSYGIMLMEVLAKRRPTDEEICNENLKEMDNAIISRDYDGRCGCQSFL